MSDAGRTRIVRCCLCGGMMRVSARALSVPCPHCHKAVSLENLRVVGSHPGKALATCGNIFIEQAANLNLVVMGRNVMVHGRVKGPVSGSESVEVGPTGKVIGDIKAPKIVIRDGAVIEGACRMIGVAPTRTTADSDGEPTPGLPNQPVSAITAGLSAGHSEAGATSSAVASAQKAVARPRPLPQPRLDGGD